MILAQLIIGGDKLIALRTLPRLFSFWHFKKFALFSEVKYSCLYVWFHITREHSISRKNSKEKDNLYLFNTSNDIENFMSENKVNKIMLLTSVRPLCDYNNFAYFFVCALIYFSQKPAQSFPQCRTISKHMCYM